MLQRHISVLCVHILTKSFLKSQLISRYLIKLSLYGKPISKCSSQTLLSRSHRCWVRQTRFSDVYSVMSHDSDTLSCDPLIKSIRCHFTVESGHIHTHTMEHLWNTCSRVKTAGKCDQNLSTKVAFDGVKTQMNREPAAYMHNDIM